MPNRIIKESICASSKIDGLTWFEESFFYRLMVNVDDYGRFDARIAILRARLFPLKTTITDKLVESALAKLAVVGLAITYTVEDKPYLYLPAWGKHQSIRNLKSKYPEPNDTNSTPLKVIAINCNQLQANVPVIQSNPNSNTNPTPAERERRFDSFWNEYPKKTAKATAEKAFDKLKLTDELIDIIMSALETHKASEQWQKDGGKYIPHPATWLNQRRWEDEIEVTGSAGDDPNIRWAQEM